MQHIRGLLEMIQTMYLSFRIPRIISQYSMETKAVY